MEARRLQLVREKFDAWGIDALLVTSPFNRMYLTGFTGSAGYVVITKEQAILLTDFRYEQQAQAQTKVYEVRRHAVQPIETINETLNSLQVKKLGFEQHVLSYENFIAYRETFAGIDLMPTRHLVEHLRGFKDSGELQRIRKAIDITERAFAHILGVLKPGITERDVAAELEYVMRKNGAVSSAYSSIVASGERSALPHGLASDKAIGMNEFVTLDFGASYEGYCSDLTRTVFIGTPTARHKEIYAAVLEANQTTLTGLKPGMSAKEADSLGRDVIMQRGYGEYFGHGLGHAFGLEIHEPARFSQTSEDVLLPGMVMTVEPGIYIPGFGGVRIEDDIFVTDTGIEVLTKSSKELIAL